MLGCLTPANIASAQTADRYAFKVVRETDMQMSCEQLAQEALLMRDIIQTTEDIKSHARFNGHAVTAAAGLGSFLVGTLTGGIGFAAAGFIASQEVEEDEQSAEEIQDIAHQRRALIRGIYKAKACPADARMEIAWNEINRKSAIQAGLDNGAPKTPEKVATLEPAAGKEKIRYNE